MIVVFTGNGKGKTTATIGQMIRAIGQGKKAVMFQFIKGPWISGEHKFLNKYKTLKGKLEIYRGGKGFVGILGDKFPIKMHQKAAEDTLKKVVKAIKSKKWDIIALDEVNVAVSLDLIKASKVLKVIKKEPQKMIIILSGQYAPKSFIKRADLATEMREIKHPFSKGEKAKIGFEF
jgi:cob(I)alamin adenosyltransferase